MYPRLLHIYGPLWIHSYGFMIALGFLLFLFLSHRHFKKLQIISSEQFFNIIFLGLVAGIIGGRLFFVFSDWDALSANWLEVFYPWVGGFGILGSIIAVLIAATIYLKIHRIPVLPVFDVVSIYAPLLQAVSRLGCFFAGCCYGKIVSKDFWIAVKFSNPNGLAPLNVWLHPAQLYSVFASLLIFLLMLIKSKFFYSKTGQLIFTYLIAESISRFVVDFWRGDRDFVDFYFLSGFSSSQVVAFGLFIFGVIGYICLVKKK